MFRPSETIYLLISGSTYLSLPNSILCFYDLLQLVGNRDGELLAAWCYTASGISYQREAVHINATGPILLDGLNRVRTKHQDNFMSLNKRKAEKRGLYNMVARVRMGTYTNNWVMDSEESTVLSVSKGKVVPVLN
jgi:hypothetical protein